jgi:HlyD family secretion protein
MKVLAIPESALEFSGDSIFVYVLTDSVPEQKFDRRPVKVGMSDGIRIEVKEGLKGTEKLRGGMKE